ncbi:MAG: DASS family sodium-coupled anion symporter [Methanobrevibacter sp.]|jgi:sodium-dependent dicarboxylate transporter 2/3/5|nr:DASS family sodium-coupled anion symporter [Methanobrevibacter sp.]
MEFKKMGLPLAILVAFIIGIIPLNGLSFPGHMALVLLAFAVIMWLSEALNLAVTSLIILFIQPILGIASFTDAVVGFASPIIFLMIGGFVIAEGIRQSGLVQRLTYFMLDKVGTTSTRGLFVSVFSTGILSAWIENVVAFALLIPIIKEIIYLMGVEGAAQGKSNFAKSMILGACFASLAGGLATEIGTAPNLMAAAYTHIPFANWMVFGIPIAIILLLAIWKYLGVVFPSEVKEIEGGSATIQSKLDGIGKITKKEKLSIVLLLFTISLWITTGITGLNSYSIALIGAALFFIFKILNWRDAQKNIDWGLILFFGGALSLGAALLNTGAAEWLIDGVLSLLGNNPSTLVIIVILMVVAVLITQIMSNIALSAILIPLAVTLSASQHLEVGTFAVPIAIACSLSFMLPMADPTVAMAYGTGYVKIKEIFKAGAPIIVLGIVVTIAVLFTIGKPFLTG